MGMAKERYAVKVKMRIDCKWACSRGRGTTAFGSALRVAGDEREKLPV